MGTERTRQEYLEALTHQLENLDDATRLYDAGRHAQALPIAVALRVLFHSTGRSTSLLRHLGAESILLPRIGGTGETVAQATASRAAGRVSFTLNLEPSDDGRPGIDFRHEALVQFPRWWNDEVAFSDHMMSLSRRDLVRLVANQDGGAHIDASVSADLANLREGMGTYTARVGQEEIVTKMVNAHWRAVRIIAEEVRRSGSIAELVGRRPAPSIARRS